MTLVLTSQRNVAVLFKHLVAIYPPLTASVIADAGFFTLERADGNDSIAWCLIASDEKTSGALFVPVKVEGGGVGRLFVELQNAALASGLSHDGVFLGKTSQATAELINRSTVIPAHVLLGQS